MNHKLYRKECIFIATFCLVITASATPSLTFRVDVNTGPLIGGSGAPYAVDFQLIGGDPLGNTATISNFSFGGGAASVSPPPTTVGLATGTLGSVLTLNSDFANFFNEFFQGFTPGGNFGFDATLTANVNTPNPDAFSFAILDSTLANIPTTGLGDSLLLVNLDSAAPSVQTFAGAGALSGVTVSVGPINNSVPDTGSTFTTLGLGLLGLGLVRRKMARAVES